MAQHTRGFRRYQPDNVKPFPTLTQLRALYGDTTMKYSDHYDTAIQAACKRYWPMCPDWRWGKGQLIAESGLDPVAKSPAGAEGIAQFMPDTWAEVMNEMGLHGDDGMPVVTDAKSAIGAYAYYMDEMWNTWTNPKRGTVDRLRLAQASYNAGAGNLLKAQRLASGAMAYDAIVQALPRVTGAANARQTTDYVARIARIYAELAAGV